MIVSRSEARRPTVCVYLLIVERLVDGILGMKHGVAAFLIQFLECYYKAATCCYLVDGVYKKTSLNLYQVAWEKSLQMMSIWK